VLGFSQAEAIGQTLRLIIAPESDAFKEDPLVLARQHGSVTEDGWYVRKGGGRFWGSGLISTLYDSSGELTGYVKVLRDNTERKIADEALREAKRAADAANEAKDQFLANVSHELRTPLSAIVLWASLIEDQKMHDPEQLDEAIRAIRKSAQEQRELIEDLVDNARIIAGKLRLDPKPIDLAAVVHEGVETGRSLASEKKVTLDESSDPDVSRVMVDGGRIKQVVSNLVNNAPIKRLRNSGWDMDEEPWGVGAVITVQDMNDVQPVTLPDVSASMAGREQGIIDAAERLSGLNDVTLGSAPQESRTLGEVQMVTEQSFVRIEEQVRNLQETMEDLFKIRHELWRRAADEAPLEPSERFIRQLEFRQIEMAEQGITGASLAGTFHCAAAAAVSITRAEAPASRKAVKKPRMDFEPSVF